MSRESRMPAGILLIVLPSVMYGGLTLPVLLIGNAPGYSDNPLRQNLWRAGHAHAGVYLVLSLVMLRYARHGGDGCLVRGRPKPGERI
jgi:hypothetical protein